MSKKFWIGAGCALIMSTSAHSATWVQVGADGDGMGVWVDTDSIRFSGPHAKAWFLYNYSKDQFVPGAYTPARSSKELDVYNCSDGTGGIEQEIWTSGTSGSGQVVLSRAIPQQAVPYNEYAPDTVGEAMMKSVCGMRARKRAPSSM